MLNSNYTEKLLGLEGVILENVIQEGNGKHIYIKMEKRIHSCPDCETATNKVHDYRSQLVKDIPAFGDQVILHLRKRRYLCPCCGKRFYEHIPFLPRYQHTTNRLWGYILSNLHESRSMKDIAFECGVSQTTIARVIDCTSCGMRTVPSTIAIDEFKGNSGGEKFQCIITNPKSKKVLDILPTRKQDYLCAYFSKYDNRKNVKYVVMDMSKAFKSTAEACFPNAMIIVDKFHVVRQVTWAFENVRKRVQKDFEPSRRKYFKHSRKLLLKHPNKLNEEELEQVSIMLSLSKDLAKAYWLKNLFYDLMQSKTKVEGKEKLGEWLLHAGIEPLEEFKTCIETFTNWQQEILNAFDTGLTNGFTEGCNNRIKVLKRIAYGMINFDRFRKRILHAMSS